jgi:vacuolar-type H+-ATPase subunit H
MKTEKETPVTEKAATEAVKNAEGKLKKKKKADRQDNENLAAATKKITDKKDLKYLYPADCDTLPKRKQFRQKARTRVESLIKDIRKTKDDPKAHKAAVEAYNEFAKTTFQKPELK